MANEETDCIDLPGGWSIVRCNEDAPLKGWWFLSGPDGLWVAKFFDGPEAVEGCRAFAAALWERG